MRQTADGSLEVALDNPAAGDDVAAALGRLWSRLGVAAPQLRFVGYTPDVSVKRRRVQRTPEGTHS
ncbi:MAG: hypothetical protein ACK5KO_01180 [Arachnia sp.]